MIEHKTDAASLGNDLPCGYRPSIFQALKEVIMKDQLTLKKTLFDLQAGEILGIFDPANSGQSTMLQFLDQTLIEEPLVYHGILQGNRLALNPDLFSERIFRDGDYLKSQSSALEIFISALQPGEISFEDSRKQLKSALRYLSSHGHVIEQPLSRGSRSLATKVMLLEALIDPPDYLLLDDPCHDLNARTRYEIHDLLRSLRSMGKTATILATQDPKEAEQLCDRIVLVNQGRVMAIGDIESLTYLLEAGESTDSMLLRLHRQLRQVPVETG